MPSEEEKRSQVRIPVDEEICVRDLVSGKELGILANVHDEGFMVISDGGLKEDLLYQVALELNENDKDTAATMGVECLWISDTGTGDQVWAGFQVMEISEAAKGLIDRLVEQYQD